MTTLSQSIFQRQLGGLMMMFGICVLVYPQLKNARLTGETEIETEVIGIYSPAEVEVNHKHLEIFLVLGGVCQVVFGAFGLLVGFLAVVHDFGSLWLTRLLVLVAQTSWIPLSAGTLQITNWWILLNVSSQHCFPNQSPEP